MIDIAKFNKKKKIIVTQLLRGHYMIFAGMHYPHGTIIPRNEDPRCLIVFHDFSPLN